MRGPALPLSDLIPSWASVYFSANPPHKNAGLASIVRQLLFLGPAGRGLRLEAKLCEDMVPLGLGVMAPL